MQSPFLEACKTSTSFHHHFLGHHQTLCSSTTTTTTRTFLFYPCISCGGFNGNKNRNPKKLASQKRSINSNPRERVKVKDKENVWSVDNEVANAAAMAEEERSSRRRGGKKKKEKRVNSSVTKRSSGDKVLVSAAMLMEVETVLQTQEPVIRPAWNTFASSVSGIWKGVGAVFSPINAEMEPIDVGNKNEYLFDCYTLSRVNAVPSPSGGQTSLIERKINWMTLNPYGETQQNGEGSRNVEARKDESSSLRMSEMVGGSVTDQGLPKFESFDLGATDVMEEDYMGMEPGLVYFEDGSYSRGPVEIPVAVDESERYLSRTFKFEQCLVKGCHKRLRIVHTIDFNNGGSDIQIMRVAVYEEEWASPANVQDLSDLEFDLKPFSQRKRIQPSDLTGSWKVFEVSASPIYGDDMLIEESNGIPYVYLCTETLKKRNLPENSVYFGEEEMLDMQDTTCLWLPGGVTSYVDVSKDGILCIGVGWYSDEGINLVMERDYDVDGKLKDVWWKTEVKRRWSDPLPV